MTVLLNSRFGAFEERHFSATRRRNAPGSGTFRLLLLLLLWLSLLLFIVAAVVDVVALLLFVVVFVAVAFVGSCPSVSALFVLSLSTITDNLTSVFSAICNPIGLYADH